MVGLVSVGVDVGESVTLPWFPSSFFVGGEEGAFVGEKDSTGGLVPHPVPTLTWTSAQFQNCSGTPRPSAGTIVQTGTFPGENPSGQS